MLSLLTQLFSCCVGPRTHDDSGQIETTSVMPIATERSRLIDPPTPPAIVNIVEDAALRERMDTIVRAKEGKMFNVGMRTSLSGPNQRFHSLAPAAHSQGGLSLGG
ncbi:hypothetical protein MVEN_00923100 [Mycena venus]|uniref:Uncharacterized protein n=1 Tax=Mycena venus TaxID=2733690 RepID=A0A8H6YCS5_9AGAR|nr:hypothetical protein MVEN_00923100 [Mycena venus]